jgi:hypothetical protein
MMPKIRVNPLATRNRSSPYCSEFRHWIKNVVKLMSKTLQPGEL